MQELAVGRYKRPQELAAIPMLWSYSCVAAMCGLYEDAGGGGRVGTQVLLVVKQARYS